MIDFPPHPGTIRVLESPVGAVSEVQVDSVPEAQRFVYFKAGEETFDPEDADERVPILEVCLCPVDAEGRPVDRPSAARVILEERGPEGRLLRRSEIPALR